MNGSPPCRHGRLRHKQGTDYLSGQEGPVIHVHVYEILGGEVRLMRVEGVSVTNNHYGAHVEGSTFHGAIQDAFNTVTQLAASGKDKELQDRLKNLCEQVDGLVQKLKAGDTEQQLTAEQATRDLKILIEEASSKKPRKNQLEVTGAGLIEATKTAAEMAKPITEAVKTLLSLFT